MQYRIAEIHDLPAIVSIYNSTIRGRMVTADLEEISVESRLEWFQRHTELRPLWVVEEDGNILGWISLEPFYGRAAYHKTVEVSIYIHEDARGKGLGKKMLQFVLDQSKALDFKTVLGFVFGHNEPSIKLFEHFGFERWANMPNVAELDGIERDLVILGKRIRP
ncbi:GNAT family N-acetyltransferase [Terribacillus sp. 7520-G]|uniref:GNAT family N-acetyltransferase n=1 Tax=Terribacillus TaxID=459532 RepID=UPI000BA7BACC|nr:GNAT family N-acetyltransferase [Terribacillus sp. 7520-G]PAD37861.1 N-acetyltransferase [Terribacillus sp. 7520-G]